MKENLHHRIATNKDKNYASQISAWTIESGSMLPKTTEDLVKLFETGNSILVFDEQGSLLSHAAITYEYPDNSIEIGCVITDKNKLRNGAARHAVQQVLILAEHKYQGVKKFALANEQSSTLFEKIGAIKIPTTNLCAEVWAPCELCPRKPKQVVGEVFKCCDTAYDLSNIIK